MNIKILNIVLVIYLLVSCNEKTNKKEIFKPEFQSIIDSNNVNGSILIYDFQKDLFYSNNFDWAKVGRLPASTFKIPNSIIALETKIVENDSTLFKWNGEKRAYKIWEQDLILRNAFQYSCVPCYQEIANKIGEKRMKKYLNELQFGDMDVTSENLDLFWLEGTSKINQFQQIDFLKRLVNSELKISKRTKEIMKKISFIEENKGYKLYGKTGLSIRNSNNNGWFVGYIKSKNKIYFFATNIEPNKNTNKKIFLNLRKEITLKSLELMK
ncbi:class D beta-lactamase [Polaribacter sp. Asnod1-A03]|uniref:class D beta-lactamase n=1 Tax=Polaribacter sp. Asnod1-A03 TaxID=3160581 RepID=UPI00386DFD8E